jgi:hypothetical protein
MEAPGTSFWQACWAALNPRCIGVGDLLGELECAVGLGVGEVDDAM